MGKLYLVSLGPGEHCHLSLTAYEALETANIIIGYKKYIELVKEYLSDKLFIESPMKGEVDRCKKALELAKDSNVALISSGDIGVYGMAGILLELSSEKDNIEIIPGITSANACASLLGAPLTHDFCTISLSDLLTDYDLIMNRIDKASMADFVIVLYNPKSKKRTKHIKEARKILLKNKAEDIPVGIVRNAMRENQEVVITSLKNMLNFEIDMFTTIIIGNKDTYVKNGKIITPRGYKI